MPLQLLLYQIKILDITVDEVREGISKEWDGTWRGLNLSRNFQS